MKMNRVGDGIGIPTRVWIGVEMGVYVHCLKGARVM